MTPPRWQCIFKADTTNFFADEPLNASGTACFADGPLAGAWWCSKR